MSIITFKKGNKPLKYNEIFFILNTRFLIKPFFEQLITIKIGQIIKNDIVFLINHFLEKLLSKNCKYHLLFEINLLDRQIWSQLIQSLL